jgi:hypothetical protein
MMNIATLETIANFILQIFKSECEDDTPLDAKLSHKRNIPYSLGIRRKLPLLTPICNLQFTICNKKSTAHRRAATYVLFQPHGLSASITPSRMRMRKFSSTCFSLAQVTSSSA